MNLVQLKAVSANSTNAYQNTYSLPGTRRPSSLLDLQGHGISAPEPLLCSLLGIQHQLPLLQMFCMTIQITFFVIFILFGTVSVVSLFSHHHHHHFYLWLSACSYPLGSATGPPGSLSHTRPPFLSPLARWPQPLTEGRT